MEEINLETLTLAAAEFLKDRIYAEIRDIEAQFSAKEETLNAREYRTWEKKAKSAMAVKQKQYQKLKKYVKELRIKEHQEKLARASERLAGHDLLKEMYLVVVRSIKAGYPVSREDQDVLDAVKLQVYGEDAW